ncbi:MAG TPA: hypothetical protein PLB01_14995, partial [Thermoanaerobaculia bacterium]|nr:hypothetical protein [Thermoanaerobaculia bacterium]
MSPEFLRSPEGGDAGRDWGAACGAGRACGADWGAGRDTLCWRAPESRLRSRTRSSPRWRAEKSR